MLIIFCLLTLQGISGQPDPLVTVEQGQLRGSQHQLYDGTPYYSFKGIPYAQVTARFHAPQPLVPWSGVLDATTHGPVCPQFNPLTNVYLPGSENCLFLNVYTKSLDKKYKYPVMVFIHGGSFMWGSGNDDTFGPEYLIQHDVVLVTFNYRLEALGFLCLDTPEVPGNAGMRDQVAALKWLHKNLEQFGGNPNDITLFGVSAGSASVAYHLQSPMSKGLFHKIIMESGVSSVDWARDKDGKDRALRAASYLGYNTSDTRDALKFLQTVPAEKLINITMTTMTEDEKYRGLASYFTPVVEKRFENIEPLITEEPVDALLSGHIAKLPVMMGYNSDEELLLIDEAVSNIKFTNENPQYLVPREIAEEVPVEITEKLGKRLKSFYTNDKGFTLDNVIDLSDVLSDKYFIYSVHRFAYFYSKLAETYFYNFSLDTELNIPKNSRKYGNITKGAAHMDELFYLFNNPFNKDLYDQNLELREIIFNLTKLWTDFAKTGRPSPEKQLGVKWSPYSASNRVYLHIEEQYSVGQNPDKARIDLWDSIYCQAGLPCMSKSNL